MTTIGILSDTHAWWDERYAKYLGDCDEIWHAGDIGSDEVADKLESLTRLRAVYGNIDGWSLRCRFKQHEVFTVEGLKVLMTHIGGYPGKYAPGIRAMIMRERPDIFISGHSHILKIMNDPTLHCLHINPGAEGRYGIQTVSTLVLLKLDSGKPVGCNVIELAR